MCNESIAMCCQEEEDNTVDRSPHGLARDGEMMKNL